MFHPMTCRSPELDFASSPGGRFRNGVRLSQREDGEGRLLRQSLAYCMGRLVLLLGAVAAVCGSPAVAAEEVADADAAEEVTDAAAGSLVTVTLAGGARVTAPLLRQSETGVVLDLGEDVMAVRANRILGIQEPTAGNDTGGAREDRGLFTLGRLQDKPLSALVQHYGDGVVVVETATGLGSGFVISPHGHLVTNYHVIEESTSIYVTVFHRSENGYERRKIKDVKILAMQPLRDLALLQIEKQALEDVNVQPLVLAKDDSIRVGDMVFAIGNPLGLERSVCQGIVSSTTRTMGHLRFLQTDASINPGNSGGPLFNSRGEVVGVVCAGFTVFDGLSFGIPTTDLIDFLTHREAYLYDPAQPQNGVTYLPPPFRSENGSE